jgi:hypothetical protein
MNILMTLYVVILFFLLSPGVLVSIPPSSGKVTKAFVHAIVFGIVWHFTNKMVWNMVSRMTPMPVVARENLMNRMGRM